jgi:3'-5' exoribonuclease 1
MIFIVYDLEATCWEGRPPGKVQEIIEVGAIKVNRYGELLDSFCKFVRPVLSPNLSLFCRQLTGIDQIQVNRAGEFPEVIEAFQDWIDIYDEDYTLCSWGSFDKKMLIQDCELHDMESHWVEPHINIKRQYQEIKRLHRSRGLKVAVEKEGFEFTGEHHRGIDDARNLAKIFVKYLDDWYY